MLVPGAMVMLPACVPAPPASVEMTTLVPALSAATMSLACTLAPGPMGSKLPATSCGAALEMVTS